MRYLLNSVDENEPVVRLELKHNGSDNAVSLIGTNKEGQTWLLVSFESGGLFQPNSTGARKLGLAPSNEFFEL